MPKTWDEMTNSEKLEFLHKHAITTQNAVGRINYQMDAVKGAISDVLARVETLEKTVKED